LTGELTNKKTDILAAVVEEFLAGRLFQLLTTLPYQLLRYISQMGCRLDGERENI
jgi:hypothetical protein